MKALEYFDAAKDCLRTARVVDAQATPTDLQFATLEAITAQAYAMLALAAIAGDQVIAEGVMAEKSDATAGILGSPVIFSAELRRRRGVWDRRTRPATEGIIVGTRTLADGDVQWEPEVGMTFTPQRHFQAFLVAYALRRKPVYVLPEDLTEVPR